LSTPIALTYSRISNPSDTREASLDSQEAAQVELLESRGYEVPPELRFRERYTAVDSIYDRSVLCHIRDLIAAGRVQAMAAYDTDRLSRTPRELMTIVADNQNHGVETFFVKCDHETKGRIGELILHVKGLASALEWDAIRDRTMRGRQKIVQQGQWVGGGKPKYGYLWDKSERRRTAHPDTAPVVRRIFELVASGTSIQRVADLLNAEGVPPPFASNGHGTGSSRWWPNTIRERIRDRTYLGEVVARKMMPGEGRYPGGKKRMVPRPAAERTPLDDGRTEALVSRELFDRANHMLDSRVTKRGRPSRVTEQLLAGIIYCGRCGSRMTPQTQTSRGSQLRSYRCIARRLKDGPDCKATCGAKWVEATAWEEFRKKLEEPGLLEMALQSTLAKIDQEQGGARLEADLEQAEVRRRKLDRQARKIVDAQLEVDSRLLCDALKGKLRDIEREAQELDGYIARLRLRIEGKSGQRKALAEAIRVIDHVRRSILAGPSSPTERRKMLELLETKVRASQDTTRREVTIVFPFDELLGNQDSTTRSGG
jgi:site-specific DNA recombinase